MKKIGKTGIIALIGGVALGIFGAYKLMEKPKYIETPCKEDEDYYFDEENVSVDESEED